MVIMHAMPMALSRLDNGCGSPGPIHVTLSNNSSSTGGIKKAGEASTSPAGIKHYLNTTCRVKKALSLS